jgi:hypothetical protein
LDRVTRHEKFLGRLQKRRNDAGIRLVMAEIATASLLVSRADRLPDPEEREKSLLEARAIVAFAARIARALEVPDCDRDAITHQVQHLIDELDQLLAMCRESSAPELECGGLVA